MEKWVGPRVPGCEFGPCLGGGMKIPGGGRYLRRGATQSRLIFRCTQGHCTQSVGAWGSWGGPDRGGACCCDPIRRYWLSEGWTSQHLRKDPKGRNIGDKSLQGDSEGIEQAPLRASAPHLSQFPPPPPPNSSIHLSKPPWHSGNRLNQFTVSGAQGNGTGFCM